MLTQTDGQIFERTTIFTVRAEQVFLCCIHPQDSASLLGKGGEELVSRGKLLDNGSTQVATWSGGLSTRCFGLTRIGPGLISHMVHPIPAILNLCLPPGALQPIRAQQMVIIKVIASLLWIQQLTKG